MGCWLEYCCRPVAEAEAEAEVEMEEAEMTQVLLYPLAFFPSSPMEGVAVYWVDTAEAAAG